MRSIPVFGGVFAIAVLGSALLSACGAEGTTAADAQLTGDTQSQDPLIAGGDDDEQDPECPKIMAKLQRDAFMMQLTQEYQALTETPEYKKVEADFQKMQQKHCKMTDPKPSAACKKLKAQAMRHQQAMARTPEFEALSKTKEFKTVMKDARIAQEHDCLDGMGMTMANPWMAITE